jgi:large subunit ribosomal protein L25
MASDTLNGNRSEESLIMAQNTKTQLNLARRDTLGKKVKALRRSGTIPGNIFGSRLDSVAVQVTSDELRHLMRGHGKTEIIYVQLDGEERPTFIKNVQRNPVTDEVLHVDFQQVDLSKKVRIEVPIHFTGMSPAVDTYGGILTHHLNQVTVEALPTNIPSAIEVDVSGLTEIGSSLHVSDMTAPDDTEIVNDAESVVVRVDLPAAERSELEEEGEAEEGAEGAEGEEGAAEGGAPAEEEAETEGE